MRFHAVIATTGLGARIPTIIGTSVLAKRVCHYGSQNDQSGSLIRREFQVLSFEITKLLAHFFSLLPIEPIQDL